MIRAVVLDIGSVLEVIDDSLFPGPFERRHGLAPGSVAAACDWPADPLVGAMTEAETRAHWQRRLGLTDDQVDELVADQWRWYVGTLDQTLFDWFARARSRGLKTGIVSNSGPGAREAERHYGFEAITDDIVYSHEVGLRKPDPEIFALATSRLGVRTGEVVFLDDVPANVDAARAAGWHAVLHEATARSIEQIEAIIAGSV
ncbi:MAG TPA: HAD-IA family hydrolase [Nocardioides sp.]|jgi:HAD superfamily hydrolase (TIGR01509 family)|nr:HAD-IA family hydrolase [Nocardioides sp.]